MTHEELRTLVESIDKENAEYIMNDYDVISEFESVNRWESRDSRAMMVLKDSGDPEERAASIAEMCRRDLEEKIRLFGQRHLTPANAKVGDGATVNLWSDRHAGTIIKVTKASITIQRDKATLDPNFKPEWVAGGFAGHCTNQDEQKWSYERNEKGETYTIRWSRKYNKFGTPGNLTASKGRHEFYDYNF